MAATVPSSTHSVVSVLVIGEAITVVARIAPASRCDCHKAALLPRRFVEAFHAGAPIQNGGVTLGYAFMQRDKFGVHVTRRPLLVLEVAVGVHATHQRRAVNAAICFTEVGR